MFMDKCTAITKHLTTLCTSHSFEIFWWAGVVILYIVWPRYLFISLVMRVIASAIDMFIGFMKAKFFHDDFDSRIFWKSIIKRTVVLLFGLFLVALCWHIATLVDNQWIKTIISILPIGYFHLFTLQEVTSLLEQWTDIDPDNRAVKIITKTARAIKSRVVKTVDDKIAIKVASLYELLSPWVWKSYLERRTN